MRLKGYHKRESGRFRCNIIGIDGKKQNLGTYASEATAIDVVFKHRLNVFFFNISKYEKDVFSGKCWKNNFVVYPDGEIYNLFGKRLKYSVNPNGYRIITVNRKAYTFHRIVATLFIPNPDNKPFINHIDGNKKNNAVSNLEWCTPKENAQHAERTGLTHHARGERVHTSKLTASDVMYIRSHYKPYSKKFGGKALAEKFGITKDYIYNVIYGKKWTHIPMNVAETPSEAE